MTVKYDLLQDPNDKAERAFEQVLEAFKTHHVNPTPLNFAVWYTYFRGNEPRLREEMETILADSFGYSDRYGKELFNKYLLDNDDAMAELDRAIRHLINSIAKKIEQLAQRLDQQTQKLESCTVKLKEDLQPDELKVVAQTVLETAQTLKHDSLEFEQNLLTSAQEIQRLRKELIEARAMSTQDELTGLQNRRAFNETLAQLTVDYEDRPERLHLIMTDIDHFKKFNDTFGHLTGDSVLRFFSKLILKTQGENEAAFRYGGEEFAIVLWDSSLEDVRARAQALREKLQEAHLKRKTDQKPLGTITASFGIGEFKGPEDTIEAFIERADKALYLAKKCGRNQVKTEFDQGCG
ncbi:diguanylate cyclase [Sulfurivirga caldicuralii]|uniref:diguanylate cyclase n=1 Tax=Sulfurivirga caldicuralii TaxID=364032 RepID=A0A1N6DRU4_9GAMM|nr:GGDEF domain-containing protein [Sulfurivirga caldicuralii]SIN73404.1 diguanylate cyclase [Sulfurivirga caldicuralii]